MIDSPPSLPDATLETACGRIRELSVKTRLEGPWASGCFDELATRGVLARFVPIDGGGTAADESTLLVVLVALARVCLTTALAISQWAAGVRLVAAADDTIRRRLLVDLAAGRRFTTVGVSQVTTSRRHLATAPVVASRQSGEAADQLGDDDPGSWRIDGCCPWVTGGDSVDTIVTAAATSGDVGTRTATFDRTVADSSAFFIVDRTAPGVTVEPPLPLLALSGSRTSRVRFERVRPLAVIPGERVAAPRAGGLATSALAIGAAWGAVDVLQTLAAEPPGRTDVARVASELTAEVEALYRRLTDPAPRDPEDRDALRASANSLVTRAATAALVAAKGEGFVEGHPAGRACLEALFFQVWSCPQPLAARAMCALAGLSP